MSHGNNYFKGKKHALFFHGDFLPFAAITRAFVGCKFRGAIGIAHEVSHVSLVSNANLRIIKYHPSISFFRIFRFQTNKLTHRNESITSSLAEVKIATVSKNVVLTDGFLECVAADHSMSELVSEPGESVESLVFCRAMQNMFRDSLDVSWKKIRSIQHSDKSHRSSFKSEPTFNIFSMKSY